MSCNRCRAYVRLLVLSCGVLGGAAGQLQRSAAADDTPDSTTVFELEQGPGSKVGYRIPAMAVTKSGQLLAFCERRVGLHDHAENDIVMRRSNDGGRHWGPVETIADEGRDSLNDPCVVVLDSGRIVLRYTRFPRGVHARRSEHTVMAEPGYGGPKNVRMYLTHSDDDGETWSPPGDVTRMMRREESIAVGSPGAGLQLAAGEHHGRILFPNYEVYPLGNDQRTKANSVSYSDDGGETWKLSKTIKNPGSDGYGDEAQLAALPDGRLLLSARYGPDHQGRLLSFSRDGGESWSPHRLADGLITPACMSSVIYYSPPDDPKAAVLLHTLPHTPDSRSNGTIMISRDEGQSWEPVHVVTPDGFAYSCLSRLPDGDVGCLYETDDYHKITFARFKPKTLLLD